MINETDLFELRAPQDLFKEIQEAMVEYWHEPNSRLLLFLLFSLNHLREWIAGASSEAMKDKQKNGESLGSNEILYFTLWELEEFRIINALCNRSKHYRIKAGGRTLISTGMHCDAYCDDSFGQVYYWIDGRDSREIFSAVMRKYYEWFVSNNLLKPM